MALPPHWTWTVELTNETAGHHYVESRCSTARMNHVVGVALHSNSVFKSVGVKGVDIEVSLEDDDEQQPRPEDDRRD